MSFMQCSLLYIVSNGIAYIDAVTLWHTTIVSVIPILSVHNEHFKTRIKYPLYVQIEDCFQLKLKPELVEYSINQNFEG